MSDRLLSSLGYVGLMASDLDAWADFGSGLLGMQVHERSASQIALRMDDRVQRLIVERGDGAGPRFFGWEVADAKALGGVAEAVERAGVAVRREPRSLCDQRYVNELISFADPCGNRLEVFCGPQRASSVFEPARAISGFRTGALGMGHVLLTVVDIDAALAFYRDVLQFGISDFMTRPFRAFFLHTNPRHHSLALLQGPADGMHHLMVELFSLDDVGQGHDIATGRPDCIGQTLGRHTNDLMTSFYARTPSGVMIEYGWGGRTIDTQSWTAHEVTDGPSLWGHDRLWMPPDARQRARELVLDAGRRGLREPVQVLDGNYTRTPGACPWWDAARSAAGTDQGDGR